MRRIERRLQRCRYCPRLGKVVFGVEIRRNEYEDTFGILERYAQGGRIANVRLHNFAALLHPVLSFPDIAGHSPHDPARVVASLQKTACYLATNVAGDSSDDKHTFSE